jgi:hypothetical protein
MVPRFQFSLFDILCATFLVSPTVYAISHTCQDDSKLWILWSITLLFQVIGIALSYVTSFRTTHSFWQTLLGVVCGTCAGLLVPLWVPAFIALLVIVIVMVLILTMVTMLIALLASLGRFFVQRMES